MSTASLETPASPQALAPQALTPQAQGAVLQEMDHRIKNHLQLLASYVRLASKRRDLTVSELADNMADKLMAIAGAHDALHRAGAGGTGLARPFLETLVAAFAGSRHQIHVACDPALQLSAAQLGPVGMIVSEAIANALKHAFPAGRQGDVWVRLAEDPDRFALVVRDNGVGMSDAVGDGHSGRGLIEALARQLGGWARLGSANFGGAEVCVTFPRR